MTSAECGEKGEPSKKACGGGKVYDVGRRATTRIPTAEALATAAFSQQSTSRTDAMTEGTRAMM